MSLSPRYLIPVALVTAFTLSSCTQEPETSEPAADSAKASSQKTSKSETKTEVSTSTSVATAAIPTAHASSSVEESTPQGQYSTESVRAYQSLDAELMISDVRVGSHDGFDRVVFEYTGTGTPGYIAGYNPEPTQLASGYPIDVHGNAYIEVMIQGTPMNLLSPSEELLQVGHMDKAAGNISGITHGGVFEADTQYIIGLDRERAFNLYVLENPARIVVDVQH